ncbi:MAG: hypothetical protein B6I37_02745 [Desulfobacteraceae bacterium 4572_35.2]|nr:MAG: hypothetical protein B6I37_02745 [Desulfobacteraceae bacterium 4572_35.2]
MVTPSNPTGTVLPADQVESLYELARQNNVALILDETYNAFLPPQQLPHHLFSKDAWGETFIHIGSFGKTFALTGYRAGALVASRKLIHHALKVQDSMVVCQPRITQHAIAYGCRELSDWVDQNSVWVKHPWPTLTGRQAARKLADEANLICLPGEVFGPGLEGYLRLAFGNVSQHEIPQAVERFLVY